MTKSTLHKKKIISLAVVLTLLILGIFNLNSVSAISWPGDGAVFIPDDDHPTQYGVYIPEPDTYSTMLIDASNQGNYTIMDWFGTEWHNELVDYPGQDISEVYPWYFDTYLKDTTSNNNFTNPWLIDWINVTMMNPYDIELSNYTINSIFNYHVLTENNKLTMPLNSSIPIQIDLMISSVGPKMLKIDWLNPDLPTTTFPDPLGGMWNLISPSGKLVSGAFYTAMNWRALFAGNKELYNAIPFVAHEKGTYRLLMLPSDDKPTQLSLEFMDTSVSTLKSDSLEIVTNADELPTVVEAMDIKAQHKWYRINGEKGDLYRLDLGLDYESVATQRIDSWVPCGNGYIRNQLTPGVYDIYFPTKGTAYISFIDTLYGDTYSYSLYLEKFKTLNYTVGHDLYTIHLSRDQRKAIEFKVEQDSFVRFNYTLFEQPEGNPTIYSLDGTQYGFIFEDAKKIRCYEDIGPLDSKVVGNETFYYYYMPAGTYKALLKNNDVQSEGVIQISSQYVNLLNGSIPITSLSYPELYLSQFSTIDFEPDDYYPGIHKAQYVNIDITEPGQYFLNATIYASDNIGALPLEANPLKVVTWNSSANTYIDVTDLALDPSRNFSAFSTDDPLDTYEDRVYIAYTSKWHDMHFNFSTPGSSSGTPDIDAFFWNGATWAENSITIPNNDGTAAFTQNGTIVIPSLTATYFNNWIMGADFDLPNIDEDQYYWLAIDHDTAPTDSYDLQLPYIQTITLSNITMEGDINLALIGESGYTYCNFWEPGIDTTLDDLLINQEVGNENDSASTLLFEDSPPFMKGIEPGHYKLLIIPYGWGYQGQLHIDFGIGNFYSYRQERMYNITEEPNLYPYQINNYTDGWYGPNNITTFSYGLTTTYNDTEASLGGMGSYFVLDCYGDPYMWTQLVLSTNNVSDYNLYLMQDLPWITNNGPNMEVATIYDSGSAPLNTTYEFGVLTGHFYLIFVVTAATDSVTFRIDLTQYNTTLLTTSVPVGSYSPPSKGLSGPLVLGLAIGIPVAAGVIVLIYVLKKKGRIGSKTP